MDKKVKSFIEEQKRENREELNLKLNSFVGRIKAGEVVSFEEVSEVISYNSISKLFDEGYESWSYPRAINKLLDNLAAEHGIIIVYEEGVYTLADQEKLTTYKKKRKHITFVLFEISFILFIGILGSVILQDNQAAYLIGFTMMLAVLILFALIMFSLYQAAKNGDFEILGAKGRGICLKSSTI